MNHTLAFNSIQSPANKPMMVRGAMAQQFNKAAARAKFRRFISWINGRSTQLQSMKSLSQTGNKPMPGIQQIALDDIIGSEGRCSDFDNQFLPLQYHNRDRWVNIALARYNHVTLPPVELVCTNAGYFVRDGHHRVSVAKAWGQAVIEAVVV